MEGLLHSLDSMEIKGLLEGNSHLLQLIPVVIFSFILVKTSGKGKVNRLVPTLVNFGIILFLNAVNIVNLFLISKINLTGGEADMITVLLDLDLVVKTATYFMSGINPITIMILLLILNMVDAGVFWFGLCVFGFRMLYISQWNAHWIGWMILSIVLAFLCSKLHKVNIIIAYVVINICSIIVKILLSKVGIYAIDPELMMGESAIGFFVLITYVAMRLLKSFMSIPSLGGLAIKIGKFAVIAACVIILVVIIRNVSQNVIKNVGEKEDNALTENIAESDTEANQLVTVAKGNSSSYLLSFSTGKSYTVDLSFDADLLTCWQDGSSEDGSGESLGYSFDGEHSVGKVSIYNGNLLSQEKYEANNRVQNAILQFYHDGNMVYEQSVYLSDDFEQSQNGISFILEERIACDQVILQVIDVYAGNRYNDLCIAEVKFYE